MGNLLKFIVTYKQPFWRTAGLSGELVTSAVTYKGEGCNESPICVLFDATSHSNNAALVGFIGGEQLIQYGDMSVSHLSAK